MPDRSRRLYPWLGSLRGAVRPPAREAARTAGGAALAAVVADDPVVGAVLLEVVVLLLDDGEEEVVVGKTHTCNFERDCGQFVSASSDKLVCQWTPRPASSACWRCSRPVPRGTPTTWRRGSR